MNFLYDAEFFFEVWENIFIVVSCLFVISAIALVLLLQWYITYRQRRYERRFRIFSMLFKAYVNDNSFTHPDTVESFNFIVVEYAKNKEVMQLRDEVYQYLSTVPVVESSDKHFRFLLSKLLVQLAKSIHMSINTMHLEHTLYTPKPTTL